MKQVHLIGRKIKVVQATNQSIVGIEGNVLDDTSSTLLVNTSDGNKRILKKGLMLEVDNEKIIGDNILGTPSERL